MIEKEFKNIEFRIEEDNAFLTINRPPVNILNIATMEEINESLVSLFGNTEVKETFIGPVAFHRPVEPVVIYKITIEQR